MSEHRANRNQKLKFAGKYFCYNLIYYEEFHDIRDAISREKELKKWRREKSIWQYNDSFKLNRPCVGVGFATKQWEVFFHPALGRALRMFEVTG